jgi:cytochrome P450
VNFFRRLKAKAAAGRSAEPVAVFDLDGERSTHPPFPALAELRGRGDVHFLPRHGCWIVLGYDSVKDALGRPDIFSSSPQDQVDTVLLGADPPRHEAARRRVGRHMTGVIVSELVAGARRDATGLIQPTFDLAGDFAAPLARASAARLVGLDVSDLTEALEAPDLSLPAAAMAAESRAVLERSRLFSALLRDGADEAGAVSLVRLLCRAATETTERLIVRAGAFLLGDEHLRSAVDRNPAVIAALVEEVARLLPPEPNVARLTTRAAPLGGARIPEGALVLLSLLAANRDPRRFEEPDTLRLDRGRNAHLAFSGGPHHCIGAGLGRQLAVTAVACLAEHKVRLVDPDAPTDLTVVQRIATPRRLAVGT